DVLLWPDTFNNHFHPETARAAVEVLEAAGFHVIVPRQSLCCGRPLYDFGMLDRAEEYLKRILHTLEAEIEAGIPVAGLEPSCSRRWASMRTFSTAAAAAWPARSASRRSTMMSR